MIQDLNETDFRRYAMSEKKRLSAPLTEAAVADLRAGDEVLISGVVYAARDQAHKRLCDLLERGEPLPVNLEGAIIYFVGPTPAGEGRAIGSAGPTTRRGWMRLPEIAAGGTQAKSQGLPQPGGAGGAGAA